MQYPVLLENALRQLIAVSPDLQTCMSRISCDECSRADVMRAVAGGAGCRRSRRACRCPPAPGSHAAASSRGRSESRSSVYGAGCACSSSTRESRPPRPRRAAPILVTVFLRGRRRCAVDALPGRRPALPEARPQLALAGGSAFAEDARLRWHPALAPLAQLHGEGKVSVLPAVGYAHPDQSHFTSRHFWEVGATDTALLTGWMGRYLDRAGRATTRCRACRSTASCSRRSRRRRCRSRRSTAPDQYGFWAPGVWGEVESRMLDAIGTLGGAHRRGSGVPRRWRT